MKKLAVIGYPIGHSLSPVFQQAALDVLGLNASYGRVEVLPQDLPDFVAGLRSDQWLGVNVTVPHKEVIIPLLDGLSPEAEAIGAVNTVIVSQTGRGLLGHNTDAAGFLRALQEDGAFDPAGKSVTLLGAGGAARAVAYSLMTARVGRIAIFNRHGQRAVRLAQACRGWSTRTEVRALPWEEAVLAVELRHSQLVVNATSVGLAAGDTPVFGDLIPPGALVFDLIYNPRPTRFLREAAARGARSLDGLSMLVYQGAASFELWTGRKAPVEAMMEAAERAVEGRQT